MNKTKLCCSGNMCEHEITVNWDKATGWVISTNSPNFAKIMESVKNEPSVLGFWPLAPGIFKYAELTTKDPVIVKNLISEMEA